METLNPFSIPIEGLKDGLHRFDFQIDKAFFKQFEQSPVQDGNFDIRLFFEKRPDLMILSFDFEGFMMTECDRCLEKINLPIKNTDQLIVKYADEPEEDAEVIYITRGTSHLNVAKYIYEFICLAIPMASVYDCEDDKNPPCNFETLKYLTRIEDDENADENANPMWDALKKLKNNKGLSN